MNNAAQPKKNIIDETSYDLDQFSAQIQQAVGTYNRLLADLQTEQLAVMKTNAAMQVLGAQITEAVKKELEEKASAEAVPAPAAEGEGSAD